MISREFRNLFNSLSDQEIVELAFYDPFFLENFCYMLTLELQINRENKRTFAYILDYLNPLSYIYGKLRLWQDI